MSNDFERDTSVLKRYQSLPLTAKIYLAQNRIRGWYEHWNGKVYVSFSGGKDSTVLAHLVRKLYPEVPLLFVNTGLEFPEIQSFARKMGAEFVYPKMRFSEVISTYGYPLISKENAEAIYYARRIKNGTEGGATSQRKQAELLGNRPKTNGSSWDANVERGVQALSVSTEGNSQAIIRMRGGREIRRECLLSRGGIEEPG